MKKIIIASSKSWFNEDVISNFKNDFKVIFVKNSNSLVEAIKNNPDIKQIFFVHWNWKVAESIYNNYYSVCFHIAPLPKGRGGSPIQNLILKGYKSAPLNALIMTDRIDAGPILLSKEISLSGSLDQIFKRMKPAVIGMINEIGKKIISPKLQTGKIEIFKRLQYSDNQLPMDTTLNDFYNRIRMIDNEDYPNAYLKYGKFFLEISDAKLFSNKIEAKINVSISEKKGSVYIECK